MDIALAADDFIRHGTYLRNWSPRTVMTSRTGINALRNAVGTDSELTKTDLHQFVISMRERGLTAGGCNMYIRTINSFLTWLHEDDGGFDVSVEFCCFSAS
jgi:site-specific recombinase XerC